MPLIFVRLCLFLLYLCCGVVSTSKPHYLICCCCCCQVDDAFDALLEVFEDILQALLKAALESRPKAKPPTADELLFVDEANTAVWIKLPTTELRELAKAKFTVLSDGKEPVREQQLRTPYDRNGALHKKTNVRTCDELDAALRNYRSECRSCLLCRFVLLLNMQLTKAALPEGDQELA
jgi:hypothetical protein